MNKHVTLDEICLNTVEVTAKTVIFLVHKGR